MVVEAAGEAEEAEMVQPLQASGGGGVPAAVTQSPDEPEYVLPLGRLSNC